MDTLDRSCVLLLDLPHSALGGIDLVSFTTTPRFKGIKSLPPGFHFVFTSPTTALSIRHGAWFYVDEASTPLSNIYIKKWDSLREVLVSEDDQASALRWRANIGSIWKEGLTPYRQSASRSSNDESPNASEVPEAWRHLTSYITTSLLARITGGTYNHWNLTSASSASMDIDHIPGLSALESSIQPEKELNFLPINLKQTWREGATGRERTESARDRSWALNDVITRYCTTENELEVLGELQFSFLMVLTLNNNSCLEQWKRVLGLLFTCRRAVIHRPNLFVNLITTLKLQLERTREVEGGLFDVSEDGGAIIRKWLRDFKRGLEQESGPGREKVADELEGLEDFIKDEFGWDLQHDFVRNGMLELEDGERVEMDVGGDDEADELGEYAPTVVELTPQQIKTLDPSLQPATYEDLLLVDDEDELETDEFEENESESMDNRY